MASGGKADLEERSAGNCYVALTQAHLNIPAIMDRVRSPKAGAIVLFAGIYAIPAKQA